MRMDCTAVASSASAIPALEGMVCFGTVTDAGATPMRMLADGGHGQGP